jgi:hypothetical protein
MKGSLFFSSLLAALLLFGAPLAPVSAEVCRPVEALCSPTDVVDTLRRKGPKEGNVKIVFAAVGGQGMAFVVSENTRAGFFAITIATAHYSQALSKENVGTVITSFRLGHNGILSHITGESQGMPSFVSLVGKAFAYGPTSITFPLSELSVN